MSHVFVEMSDQAKVAQFIGHVIGQGFCAAALFVVRRAFILFQITPSLKRAMWIGACFDQFGVKDDPAIFRAFFIHKLFKVKNLLPAAYCTFENPID